MFEGDLLSCKSTCMFFVDLFTVFCSMQCAMWCLQVVLLTGLLPLQGLVVMLAQQAMSLVEHVCSTGLSADVQPKHIVVAIVIPGASFCTTNGCISCLWSFWHLSQHQGAPCWTFEKLKYLSKPWRANRRENKVNGHQTENIAPTLEVGTWAGWHCHLPTSSQWRKSLCLTESCSRDEIGFRLDRHEPSFTDGWQSHFTIWCCTCEGSNAWKRQTPNAKALVLLLSAYVKFLLQQTKAQGLRIDLESTCSQTARLGIKNLASKAPSGKAGPWSSEQLHLRLSGTHCAISLTRRLRENRKKKNNSFLKGSGNW